MSTSAVIDRCRVPESVRPQRCGLWEIRRAEVPEALKDAYALAPYSSFTALYRDTVATLHEDFGEVVMEDSPRELRRHLPILLRASGRVLVSGLGLGCVVRGLLAKPEVLHVDVVEIDPSILTLVGAEFMENPRVTLHLGDAETIEWPVMKTWDYAWHDVWSETEGLAVVHARILARYRDRVKAQGAWQFPRILKRLWPDTLLGGARDTRCAA